MPAVYVTNFNPNFTGVSATAAAVVRAQARDLDVALVGHPLPGCPDPISASDAQSLSREAPPGRPFSIWHVRRNPEMRRAIWTRDVLRRPIRIVFTSAAQRRHSAYPRWLISRMDAVIATSEIAASFVPHVRAVVHHGVDNGRFRPAPDRAAAWAATGYPGARGIATVGRVRPEKGTDVFVDAMIRLLPHLPDVTALVIGRTAREFRSFEADLKGRVAAAGLAERILFIGELAPDRTPEVMRALSLVINLPRYEGYGIVPLEAMASGTPFVASETGHYRAFSDGGQAGVVVGLEEPKAAQGAVRHILEDPALHARMAAAAQSHATRHYSVDREAAAINAIYEDLWSEG